MTDSHIFDSVGSKEIGQYDCENNLNPFCFQIAVTCGILNSSGKNPSLNMSLNKELKGKDIGVAIRDKKNFHGTAQLD